MPFEMKWYIPQRVLYVRLWGTSSVEEAAQSNLEMTQFLDAGKPLVHMIFDDGELEKVPSNVGQLQKTMQVFKHPPMGWLLPVGDVNPLIRFLSYMAAQIFRIRFRRSKTIGEALEFLKSQDLSLDWETADQSVLAKEQVHP